MQITEFGTRGTLAVTVTPGEVPNITCGAQGLWLYLPSTATVGVVFGLASSITAANEIGELVPGESQALYVAASAGVPIYAYTRTGTATLSYGGIE